MHHGFYDRYCSPDFSASMCLCRFVSSRLRVRHDRRRTVIGTFPRRRWTQPLRRWTCECGVSRLAANCDRDVSVSAKKIRICSRDSRFWPRSIRNRLSTALHVDLFFKRVERRLNGLLRRICRLVTSNCFLQIRHARRRQEASLCPVCPCLATLMLGLIQYVTVAGRCETGR